MPRTGRYAPLTVIALAAVASFLGMPEPTAAQHEHHAASAPANDSAAVAAVVHEYHQALASGDSTAAMALLAADVVILESGGMETREEYRSHHLQSDIAFARAVTSDRGPIAVEVRGDVAWAASTSTTRGQYRDRTINSAGAELMVLTRTPDGWRISAIHWSSRNVRS